jgi:hypothetical protein
MPPIATHFYSMWQVALLISAEYTRTHFELDMKMLAAHLPAALDYY